MLARKRYLKVYSPTGRCSKKKFEPESRVSSYQAMPRSYFQRDTAFSGSRPAARGSRRCTYSAACLVRSETCTSTWSPALSTAPSASGLSTHSLPSFSRLKYLRDTWKKSPRSSLGSCAVEKCQVAEANMKPLVDFSTVTVELSAGLMSGPATTICVLPTYLSGSKVKVCLRGPTVTVASSLTPRDCSFAR